MWTQDTPLLLDLAEVAKQLRISQRSVAALVADGSLASVKIGARRLVRREALVAFVEALDAE